MKLVDKDEIMKFPIRLDHYDETNGRRRFVLGIEAVLEYIHEMPTVKAIPVEWIYKWLENIPNNWRGYADDWNYNIESEVKKIIYKNNTVILLPCITDMLDDWMEENK